eukprot:CAMPEP_0197593628 /NCGR_PEP_ID=MMETSP1326-20131121/18631_1 /TAXON_ID=1155430 /ORGANISM="Genus nov. species nov., Strain RCC2288" /LENGTH=33 /DNA_ID= /DNA_START= /DNA_END= /DNA_ORIENTATION=
MMPKPPQGGHLNHAAAIPKPPLGEAQWPRQHCY